ncbi:ABC transporter ATP-binding protein [Planotetraspora sp. GP83]|uniref:ABC transporter ATP-binding protein n=1 Tax=Planotetraspora sp. GP83 TaxID=3156264 RepID=UPI003516528E
MLTVTDLNVSYGRIAAVRGVSLGVAPGEIVAVIGANGAGKSSTLAAIAGVVASSGGSIELDGVSLVGRTPERIARQGIALVPEGRDVFATLTVAENLHLGTLARKDRRSAKAATEEVLERFPMLRRYYRSPAGKLSGGEQQQLAIARALLTGSRVLLLDEPSLGLSPKMVDLVFDVISGLRDDGVGVLLVEQNAMRALALADKSYILRRGQVAVSGTRDELAGQTELAAMYLS